MSKNDFDIEHFPTNPTALRMMSRISPIYERSYVGKWIFEVMGMDMDEVRLRFDELRLQAFPETATWGLIYWEQRYGLPIGEGFDYEVRRRRILAKCRSRGPLNPKRVESILSELTGRDVIVTENVADYTFRVQIEAGDNPIDIAEVMRKIKKIKPSHQAYNLQVALQTTKVITAVLTETKLAVEVWPDSVASVELAPARIITAGAVWPRITATVLPETVEKVSSTAEVAVGVGAEVKTTAQAWPDASWHVETTAEVAVGAAAQIKATAQPWPEAIRRAETTVEVATGAGAQVEAGSQTWPGTIQGAEATAETHTRAGTQRHTVTKVWPGAVERVETKTTGPGAFVEVHQTIEIWP